MTLGVCCGADKLELVKKAGYDYWEVHFANLAGMTEEAYLEIKEKSEKLHLPAEASNCFFPGGMKLYGDDLSEVAAHARIGLKRLAGLGGKIAVIGSGASRKIPAGENRQAIEEKFVDLLRCCGDIAAEYGIILAVEPLNKTETNFINTLAEGLEICKKADHPNVKCLVDFYHLSRESESLEHVEKAGKDLVHTHIAVGEDRHVPTLADAEICRQWKAALNTCRYDGRISLEGKWASDYEEALNASVPAMEIFR